MSVRGRGMPVEFEGSMGGVESSTKEIRSNKEKTEAEAEKTMQEEGAFRER